MISDFFIGISYVTRGFSLIRRPGIRRFVIMPLLINIILFAAGITWLAGEFGVLMEVMLGYLPTWLDWLSWILWPLFALSVMIIVFYTFTILANLIGAPFNSVLAEKLEADLSGEKPGEFAGYGALVKDIGKSLTSELKKLIYLALWMIPLLILFIIPGINLFAPFIMGLFSAWMLALEYNDYPLGNHGYFFRDVKRVMARNRGLALGFGGAIMLISFIPILNFLAMPVGVTGATAMWVERIREREKLVAAKG
jgi:CysZ protein